MYGRPLMFRKSVTIFGKCLQGNRCLKRGRSHMQRNFTGEWLPDDKSVHKRPPSCGYEQRGAREEGWWTSEWGGRLFLTRILLLAIRVSIQSAVSAGGTGEPQVEAWTSFWTSQQKFMLIVCGQCISQLSTFTRPRHHSAAAVLVTLVYTN